MTEFFQGKKSQFSWAREVASAAASYADSDGMDNADAAFTGGLYIGHKINHEPADTTEINPRYTNNTTREVAGYNSYLKRYTGSLSFDLTNFTPFYYMLGTCATTGAESPYTHAFSVLNTDNYLPSFVMEKVHNAETADVLNYLGCVVDRMTLSTDVGQPIRCKLDYIAQSIKTDATKETVAANTANAYMQYESSINADFVNAGEPTSLAELSHVIKWSLELNNNNMADPVCDGTSNYIARPNTQDLDGTLTITTKMTDDAYYDYMQGITNCAVQLSIVRTAGSNYGAWTWKDCVLESPDQTDVTTGTLQQTTTIKLGQFDSTGTNATAKDALTNDYYEVL